MPRTSYLLTHHGSLWFQIRVPASHRAQYGARIRTCLQTNDSAMARPLALRLASEWLIRFSQDPSLAPALHDECFIGAPASGPATEPVAGAALPPPASLSVSLEAPREGAQAHGHCADMLSLFRYWRSLNTDRAPSTVKEFESLARSFKASVGKAPWQLVRTDIAGFRDHLLKEGAARATVTKKLSFVNAMLQSAFDAGFLPSNVARGMKVPRPKVEPITRMGFEKPDLERIFSSRIYTDGFRPKGGGEDAFAWVPMLAHVAGGRLEELCQLRLTDVLQDGEHGWYLRIGDGVEQRVKTVSSRRLVPLHPAIVEAGFIRYVHGLQMSGQEWVFPALEPDTDGRRGGNFGKVFARFLRHRDGCGIADERLVFHSFRHTFKTLCRQSGIAEDVHDALTGHVGQSVGRDYGRVPLSTLAEAVCRIKLPVALPKLA